MIDLYNTTHLPNGDTLKFFLDNGSSLALEGDLAQQRDHHGVVAGVLVEIQCQEKLQKGDQGVIPIPIHEMSLKNIINFQKKYQSDGYCWNWTGSSTVKGYGKFRITGTLFLAHRVAYALSHGSVPFGLTIDHRCRNLKCVNPGHLEAVPEKVNILRSDGWSAINARKTHCPIGHELTPDNITSYSRKLGRRHCLRCSREKAKINSAKHREARRNYKRVTKG